ncbi:MAG: LysR family transcriptional regulator [Boseongicola sp.]|nr:MAG: LysR family transcriptional regulator [Boseongicola sp.]
MECTLPSHSNRKDFSLKSLELFQICAEKGSLQATADEAGLSISTVSHHLRVLEESLGVDLFNHARRPLVLTPKGRVFLRNIDSALHSIRKAKAEASAGNIAEASYLRIGTIEDFDSDIIPDLAVFLSSRMPKCDFTYITDTSQNIIELLRDRQIDLGVTSSPPERLRDLHDRPLLHDPFVAVLPRTSEEKTDDILNGNSSIPFLRFSSNLMIARQIEGQLRRVGISAQNRFECSSNQTLMAMVAAGAGWTITTPLLFSRAKRFQSQLSMQPFPAKEFGRTLAIATTPDCSRSVLDIFDDKMRSLVAGQIINPLCAQAPWLASRFRLLQ